MINRIKDFLDGFCDAALIISEENIRYFTSFTSSNGYLLITKDKAVFLTDSRYIEAAHKTITNCDEICEFKSVDVSLAPIVKSMDIKSIAIEQSRMTISAFEQFKKAFSNVNFETSSKLDDEINLIRSVKNNEEKEKTQKAQDIAELAFSHILSFIKAGITEREISLELDYTMLKNGADALSFETIAVAGANGSMPHGVPGFNKVKDGDFITMDFGAVYDGYHSDMTRTVAVGQISDKQADVYNTVLRAQKSGLDLIKAGVSCKDVDACARNIIKDKGYGEYFGHGFGHGVGIEIHEYPALSPKSTAILQTGNIVTAEPGIYIPTQFGVRIEDMVMVTDDGYYNFTKCEKKLIVI